MVHFVLENPRGQSLCFNPHFFALGRSCHYLNLFGALDRHKQAGQAQTAFFSRFFFPAFSHDFRIQKSVFLHKGNALGTTNLRSSQPNAFMLFHDSFHDRDKFSRNRRNRLCFLLENFRRIRNNLHKSRGGGNRTPDGSFGDFRDTISPHPQHSSHLTFSQPNSYRFVSLCAVCFRHMLQNFFNSNFCSPSLCFFIKDLCAK